MKFFVNSLLISALFVSTAFALDAQKVPDVTKPQEAQPKEFIIKEDALQNVLNALDGLQGPKHTHVMQIIQYIQKNVKLVEKKKVEEPKKD